MEESTISRDDESIERIINEAQLIRSREDKIGLEMDLAVAERESKEIKQKLQDIEQER